MYFHSHLVGVYVLSSQFCLIILVWTCLFGKNIKEMESHQGIQSLRNRNKSTFKHTFSQRLLFVSVISLTVLSHSGSTFSFKRPSFIPASVHYSQVCLSTNSMPLFPRTISNLLSQRGYSSLHSVRCIAAFQTPNVSQLTDPSGILH